MAQLPLNPVGEGRNLRPRRHNIATGFSRELG